MPENPFFFELNSPSLIWFPGVAPAGIVAAQTVRLFYALPPVLGLLTQLQVSQVPAIAGAETISIRILSVNLDTLAIVSVFTATLDATHPDLSPLLQIPCGPRLALLLEAVGSGGLAGTHEIGALGRFQAT